MVIIGLLCHYNPDYNDNKHCLLYNKHPFHPEKLKLFILFKFNN